METWDRDRERDNLADPRGPEDPEGAWSAAAPRLEKAPILETPQASLRETGRPMPADRQAEGGASWWK